MTFNIVSSTDAEFNTFINEWAEQIEGIHLPPDINTQIGTQILSDLDQAYAILRVHYSRVEAAKDRVDSIIRQKERSKAEGSNEHNRRKNATEYLENYPNGDQTFDMYEYQRQVNRRFFMMKGLLDVINNKQQRLITMTGLIKIDSSLGMGDV